MMLIYYYGNNWNNICKSGTGFIKLKNQKLKKLYLVI